MSADNALIKCPRCQGDGFYWRVPNGFNPFYAGARATAAASRRVECWKCSGTGKAAAYDEDASR